MQSRFTTSQLYLRKYLLRILSCLMFKHAADESQNTLRITFFRRFSYQRLYQMMYLTAVKPYAIADLADINEDFFIPVYIGLFHLVVTVGAFTFFFRSSNFRSVNNTLKIAPEVLQPSRFHKQFKLAGIKPDAVTDGTIIQLYILILNNQSILMTYRTHHITVFLNSIIRV